MKTFTVPPQLQAALDRMSSDMTVPVEGLVNQAVFNWAKLHGYLEPGSVQVAPPHPDPLPKGEGAKDEEPMTNRVVPVVEDPAADWKLAAGGSFGTSERVPDVTSPSQHKQQRVILVLEDREVVIDSERFLVGRDVSCDLTIDAPRISRQHAILHILRDGVEVEDLNSSNGTWFEGVRVDKRKLVDGDEVLFGDVPVRLEIR